MGRPVLGKRGLAATANANLLLFLIVAIIFGFGMSATVLIGQCMGRRDIDGVRRAVGTGMSRAATNRWAWPQPRTA